MQYYQIEHLQIAIQIPTQKELLNLSQPYWAKVWHSAIALSRFIVKNNHLIYNKKVLEIAAGLGLPSIVAANYAKDVVCTDASIESIAYIKENVNNNKKLNIKTMQLNWNNIPSNLDTDVLLMSDVNYEPAEFDTLHQLFLHFINNDTTIILATPQRLMAKPFIEKLLSYCLINEEMKIDYNKEIHFINVMVLKK